MKKFLKSFKYALNGIRSSVSSERNIKIHFAAFFTVVVLGILLEIQKLEMIAVLLICAAVISLEMTNTAIERFVDAVSPEFNEKMGLVKDIMAGAVLFLSIISVVIGILIFWKPLWELIFGNF